jgi:hydrogenase small subunit
LANIETFYDVMRRQGITRRSFMKYCSLTASALGLGPAFVPKIAHAMETKPRTPVIWVHGLECTCCSESFIRSAHPLAKDVVLSMISLDYDDTLMAAAGHAAEAAMMDTIEKYKGQYILAVEGNPPLNEDGMFCISGGKPFVEKLKMAAKDAKAVISWGACASYGCVQAAKPNPTQATPVHKVITDKPIIKVPGCPPIAEVMTGVITYMLTFDRLPELDVFMTSAIAGHISMRASSSKPGTTTARARAIASTRWAARARPPTTPVRPCAGTRASAFRSSQAMAVSAVPKTGSGIRARSMIA